MKSCVLRATAWAYLCGSRWRPRRSPRLPVRVRRVVALLPEAGERAGARVWAGLRPATPSNVPLVGRTRHRNLFLDTGHGTMGWTMACGSGRGLADVIAGRKPAVDFEFT